MFERSIIDLFGEGDGKETVGERTIVHCFLRYVGRLYRFVVSRRNSVFSSRRLLVITIFQITWWM